MPQPAQSHPVTAARCPPFETGQSGPAQRASSRILARETLTRLSNRALVRGHCGLARLDRGRARSFPFGAKWAESDQARVLSRRGLPSTTGWGLVQAGSASKRGGYPRYASFPGCSLCLPSGVSSSPHPRGEGATLPPAAQAIDPSPGPRAGLAGLTGVGRGLVHLGPAPHRAAPLSSPRWPAMPRGAPTTAPWGVTRAAACLGPDALKPHPTPPRSGEQSSRARSSDDGPALGHGLGSASPEAGTGILVCTKGAYRVPTVANRDILKKKKEEET